VFFNLKRGELRASLRFTCEYIYIELVKDVLQLSSYFFLQSVSKEDISLDYVFIFCLLMRWIFLSWLDVCHLNYSPPHFPILSQHTPTRVKSVFDCMVAGVFQIIFRAKIHANDVFSFFKNHF